MIIIEIIAGAIAAGIILFSIRKGKIAEILFWSNALILAALIYVGFALLAANWGWLPIEIAGVLLYGIPAFLARRRSPWWLVIGWITHAGWDIGLHAGGHPGFVPHWYPGACIGFDLAVAGYWAGKILRSQNKEALK